ncbi:MAG: BON domain-containing protein [Chitinophagaceae bacterium]|nr:BON domain-containing protein [Chitinophagaceae bacterium]
MPTDTSHTGSSENNDTMILSRIKQLLHDNPAIDDSKMEVAVNDGTVILKGKADTEHEKENAQLICASVEGVMKVENHLVIEAGIAHALTKIVSRIVADDKPDKKQ